MILALDWAKAFDSINVGAMITALRRFGLPEKILRIISHIYQDRFFSVVGGSIGSTTRRQCSGISQGCPLSPFLFVMLMSVMMVLCQCAVAMRRLTTGPVSPLSSRPSS